MQKFLNDRKKMKSILQNAKLVDHKKIRPHLLIKNPAVLATFAGYLKFQIRKRSDNSKELFFRGQTKDYGEIIPSLLREGDHNKINLLKRAHFELVQKTRKLFRVKRFTNEDTRKILPHYGIKSLGIDMVDNLFVAIWFASYDFIETKGKPKKFRTCVLNKNHFGWIYFFEVNKNAVVDLRQSHSSLSARLHCQHGLSFSGVSTNNWSTENKRCEQAIVATAKFPINKEFQLTDKIFSPNYFFPNDKIDNTFKLLKQKKFANLLKEIEKKYGLNEGELGQINRIVS